MDVQDLLEDERKSPLVVTLAAVFAGLTVVLVTLTLATAQWFVLLLALPFGATAYLMWFHGTGRLRERTRRRVNRGDERVTQGTGGFGAGARRAASEGPRERFRQRQARAGPRGRADGGGPTGGFREGPDGTRGTVRPPGALSTETAYRRLDLSPDADADAVRQAYRDKVKEVHPDRPDGDEEAFKRVNDAYETLQEREL